MNKMDERKKELIQLIKKHNDLYWNNKELEISDVEYDKLVEELRTLDPKNELVTEFAQPNLSKEKLIKHSKPMLSLAKIYSKEDIFLCHILNGLQYHKILYHFLYILLYVDGFDLQRFLL